MPKRAVGVAAVGVVVVAIALILWGVTSMRGDGGAPRWTIDPTPAGAQSTVLLFNMPKREAHRVPVPDRVSGARWLKPGETWLALQLDAARVPTPPETDVTYRVYDAGGDRLWLVPPELTRSVLPAPDGKTVLIERIDNQYIIARMPSGLSGGFLSSARDLSFSMDGTRVAYVTLGGSDKENVIHDWRSVIEGEKSDLTGYGGGGLAIQSQREADGLMDLPADPWSPDSAYLLVQRDAPCPPPVADAANCHGTPTFYGTQETGQNFWHAYAGRLRSVQWAGPGHLFVTFYRDAQRDPAFPDAGSLIVDLGLQKQAAPAIFQGACCVSFSPDGRYAVVGHGGDEARSQRCSLVDAATGTELAGFDSPTGDIPGIFCGTVSWTPDGTQALVSLAPGH